MIDIKAIRYDSSIVTLVDLQLILRIVSKVACVNNCIDSYNTASTRHQ